MSMNFYPGKPPSKECIIMQRLDQGITTPEQATREFMALEKCPETSYPGLLTEFKKIHQYYMKGKKAGKKVPLRMSNRKDLTSDARFKALGVN